MTIPTKQIGFTCLLAVLSMSLFAESLHIAVAANFKQTLQEIAEQYTDATDVKLTISSASTGVIAAQITQGAPFDLFFAADVATPHKLAQQFSLPAPVTYAIGQLVFWCPNGAPKTERALKTWQGQYALADAKHAPYGKAAQAVIHHLDWPPSNQAITGSNIAQASHFVSTGAVRCGFVARSMLPEGTEESEIFSIPQAWHTAIEQQAVVLKTDNRSTAQAFLTYVLDEGKPIITNAGYQ